MADFDQELATVRKAIFLASQKIQRLATPNLAIQIKTDGSPVTSADLEVNRVLQKILLEKFPEDGWLSEESLDSPNRLTKTRVWILDPIDGTKPFIRGMPQYAISLALIERGQPVLSVIFNPATQEYFCAVKDQPSTLNGQEIHIKNTAPNRFTFLVNPWNMKSTTIQAWQERADCHVLLGSIAYSLALVASGRVDGVINIGRQNEWDIAAALLIIHEAGGVVVDKNLQPIQCNQPQPVVNGILAARPDAMPQIQQFLNSLHS